MVNISAVRRRTPSGSDFKSMIQFGLGSGPSVVWPSTATDAERRQLTLSFWGKSEHGFDDTSGAGFSAIESGFASLDVVIAQVNGSSITKDLSFGDEFSEGVNRDAWTHWVAQWDTSAAAAVDRLKLFRDNVELTPTSEAELAQNTLTSFFLLDAVFAMAFIGLTGVVGRTAIVDLCPGNTYAPSAFALDVGGVWTARSAPAVDYGTHGLRWDGSDGFNDVSGNGLHLTVENFDSQIDGGDVPPHQ